jgi:putative ABC transport system permease protein
VQQGDPTQAPAPQLLVPYAQRPVRAFWFVVRSAGDPHRIAPTIRATIRGFDPDLAVSTLTLLDDLHAGATARPRFYAGLLGLFAAVALALALTGIVGVMSYTVAECTREIGIRLALGADTRTVLRMIVGRAVGLARAGSAIGVAAAAGAGRVIRHQLFGVEVLDPLTLGTVVVLLLTSVAAASVLPAHRAASVDPTHTLRQG